VDQRLVRERYIESCSHAAAALYLFLVTVADHEGLSYYSDASLMTRLSMDALSLEQVRSNLVAVGLIAFKPPLYQVLSLDPMPAPAAPPARASRDQAIPIGEIFKQMMGGAR
jgi:hypothetical protein